MRHHLRRFWTTLKTENATPARLVASVWMGLFLGIVPLYGVQTLLVIGLARLLRLNTLTAVAAAQISLPILAPVWVAGGIALGEWLRFGRVEHLDWSGARDFLSGLALFGGEVPSLFLSCLLGDVVIGAVVATVGAGITAWVLRSRHASSEPCSQSDDQTAEAP